jgi:hypothetical protein
VTLIIIVLLILLLGGGLGYRQGFDNWNGGGIGIGTILLIVLIIWLLRGRL